jgi:hypothetical protein
VPKRVVYYWVFLDPAKRKEQDVQPVRLTYLVEPKNDGRTKVKIWL